MRKLLNYYLNRNKLIANSFNLMLAAAISSAFGFIFWIIVTHFFSSKNVGIATTLLSTSYLLSLIGLFGFDTVFIRFLIKEKQKNKQINSGLIITGLFSAIIAFIFCILTPIISPKLSFLSLNNLYITSFVIFTVFTTWNYLTNAIFIAYRRTSFVLAINFIFSLVKILLPLIIHSNNPIVIFNIVGVAQLINVILSLYVLSKYFNYTFLPQIDFKILKKTIKFGLTVYSASLINILPDTILPIVIINILGSNQAAYFYIASSIAGLLYTVATAITQTLLAETSRDESHFIEYAIRGLKFAVYILIPAILLILLLSPIILGLFGHNYQNEAISFLQIMSIRALAVMAFSFFGFIFKYKKDLKTILLTTIFYSSSVIIFSIMFIKNLGLLGIGYGYLIGTIIPCLISFFILISSKRKISKTIYPQNIVISHFYSKENKGDAVLLSVLIKDIKTEFKNTSITVLATDDVKKKETFERFPLISSFMYHATNKYKNKPLFCLYSLYVMLITLIWASIYRVTRLTLPINPVFKELCFLYAKADLIIPVGGGYFRGQNKGLGSLLYVMLILHPILLSYILKKPTIMYTQSVGPFSNVFEEKIVSFILNKCVQATITREDVSYKLLQRIGVKEKIYRSVDSGFAFSSKVRPYNYYKSLNIKKEQLVIGITAKKYLRGARQVKYEKALGKIIKYIVKRYKAAVVFIPQVTADMLGDDDRLVHTRIKKYAGNLSNVYAISDNLTHYEIKAMYDSLDMIIGTRFHSVIFSLTSYVPAVAIEYEHKTGGIMHDLGLDKWVIKIEEVNKNNLSKMIDRLINERKEYKKQLMNILPSYIKQTKEPIKIVHQHYEQFTKRSEVRKSQSNNFNFIKQANKLAILASKKIIQPAL